MPQANQNSNTALYVVPDQGAAFWDSANAFDLAGRSSVQRVELPAEAIKDFQSRAFMAEDADGDSIVTPFPDDIAAWAEERRGVAVHVCTIH